jgi:hypothetical protein
MKAAKAQRANWEETNLLRLISVAKFINENLNGLFKKTIITLNVLLYITYKAIKGLYLIVKLLFLTESSMIRIERDETWIFRQIK